MGLQSGSDMIATITDLSVQDMQLVLLKIDRITGQLREASGHADAHSATGGSNEVFRKALRADLDVSWIVRKVTKYSDSLQEKISATEAFLEVSKSCGFIVTPVCDPNHRHSTKRDSYRRRAECIKKDIKALEIEGGNNKKEGTRPRCGCSANVGRFRRLLGRRLYW
mmetsp:Transcript_30149/g.44558  ORF Transcript_30149/g.44558 Transcript_30149/m.44558 type:complete len:167 (+) Transcript_30149:207-707(+)